MPEQTELQCVSCGTTFDPTPHGGFCPDCDTPHPDFGQETADTDGADDTDDVAEDEPETDGSRIVCPHCGETIDLDDVDDAEELSFDEDAEAGATDASAEAEAAVEGEAGGKGDAEAKAEPEPEPTDGSDELSECPDCGHSISDEAFCPNCGTDLDAIRAGGADDAADETPSTVTLVVNGESYTFGDGDTFGRQDEAWLQDLVEAAGGTDEVSYVSGDHLEFTVEDDGVHVTDISTNGTALNGSELDGGSAKLEDGDTLELAERVEIDVRL